MNADTAEKLRSGIVSALNTVRWICGDAKVVIDRACWRLNNAKDKNTVLLARVENAQLDLKKRLTGRNSARSTSRVKTTVDLKNLHEMWNLQKPRSRFLIGEYSEWARELNKFHARIASQSAWFADISRRGAKCSKEQANTVFETAVAIEREQSLIRNLFKESEALLFLDDEKTAVMRVELEKTSLEVDQLLNLCQKIVI